MAEEQVILKLLGDATSALKALDSIFKKMQQGDKEVDEFAKSIDNLSKVGKTLGVVFGAVAAAGGTLIKSSAQVAARNEVLALSLNVVGENAGYSRDELAQFVQGVKDSGISTSEATLAITRMAQGQLDLNKATDLARVGQNLAVIANKGSSESYGILTQAINGLQPRLLRQFGIVATTNQILGDLANSTDTVAKRQRFLDFVIQEGSRVAGVYEGAMDLVGKRITSIPRLIEEVKAAFGQSFLPIWGKAVDIVSSLLKAFLNLPEPVQRIIAIAIGLGTAFSAVVAALGALFVALPFIVSAFTTLSGLIPTITAALGTMAATISPVIAPLLPIIAAIVAGVLVIAGIIKFLRKAWVENWGGIASAVQGAWATIKPLLDQLIALWRAWGDQIGTQVRIIIAQIKRLFSIEGDLTDFFRKIAVLINSIDWSSIFRTLSDALNVAFGFLNAWLQTIRGLLSGKGLDAFKPLEKAAIDGLTLVALVFEKFVSKAVIWGFNLIAEVANGMWKAAQSVVTKVLEAIGKLIGNFLAPGSPPKEGALSNIVKWGKGVMNTFLKAFGLADFGILRDALSPIQGIIQSAVSAGDLGEAESVELFQSIREQAAELIANFRDTGEISETMLGGIADGLGEGGEEYAKFLRLQLEHQKALEGLQQAEDAVAQARESGFIPAELKAQLKSAEDQVDETKNAVEWQREYLAAQQETVDIQQQLIDALAGLSEKLSEIGAEDTTGGTAEGLAAIAESALDVDAGIGAVKATIGGMSDEFLKMRLRVVGWIDAVKEWLALPFEDKISTLLDFISELTGVDIAGFVDQAIALIDEDGLVGALDTLVQAGLDYVADNFDGWGEEMATSILEMFAAFIGYISDTEEERQEDFSAWFFRIMQLFIAWIGAQILMWASEISKAIIDTFLQMIVNLNRSTGERIAELAGWFSDIYDGFIVSLENKRDGWANELRDWLGSLFSSFVAKAKAKADDWSAGLASLGGTIVQAIKDGIAEFWDVADAVGALLSTLGETIIAGEWLASMVSVGSAIVQSIKDGIAASWSGFIGWLFSKLQDITDGLPGSEPKDPRSPLRNLADAGAAIIANMQAGMDVGPMQSQLMRGMTGMRRAAVGASRTQTFGDIVFPNVRDGRDGLGVRRAIDRDTLRGSMISRVKSSGG